MTNQKCCGTCKWWIVSRTDLTPRIGECKYKPVPQMCKRIESWEISGSNCPCWKKKEDKQ